jgi:hypothetical protein
VYGWRQTYNVVYYKPSFKILRASACVTLFFTSFSILARRKLHTGFFCFFGFKCLDSNLSERHKLIRVNVCNHLCVFPLSEVRLLQVFFPLIVSVSE